MQIRSDKVRIGLHNRVGGRAIHYCRVGQLQFCDLTREDARIHSSPRSGQLLAPAREINAAGVEDKPFAIRQANHRDIESACEQISSLLVQLAEQRSANVPGTDDNESKTFTPLEESLMDNIQGARLLRRIDNARDVALGRALRDRADIYVVSAERPEHFARDTGMAFHLIADDGDNRLVWFFVERRQFVMFESKFLSHGRRRRSRLHVANSKTDRMLGGSLGDKDDIDTTGCQRAK